MNGPVFLSMCTNLIQGCPKSVIIERGERMGGERMGGEGVRERGGKRRGGEGRGGDRKERGSKHISKASGGGPKSKQKK